MKRRGVLFCLIGPSGSGKSTIAKKLIAEDGNVNFSISLTTRLPREGEIDGVHYDFVSKDEFQRAIDNNELFEWEEVHGNFYGTRKSTLESAISEGRDLILDIDIRGANTFNQHYPKDSVIIFLTPPTVGILKERLLARGAMSDEEFQRRLHTAEHEFSMLFKAYGEHDQLVDYFVVNDKLDEAYAQVYSILAAERSKLERLERHYVEEICKMD